MALALEDRIRSLCSRAVVEDDPQQLNQIFAELRSALHEHAEKLRAMLLRYPVMPAGLGNTEL
jgi:uncharacterized coiled-coil protein SlyX